MGKYSKSALSFLGIFAIFGFVKNNEFQWGEIPKLVLTSFHSEFPEIQDVEWNKENENYVAEFEINKEEISVTYNSLGIKLETEKEIKASQLPLFVCQYAKNHQLGSIKEASKILKTGGKTEYKAEISGKNYRFDLHGKLLNIEKN